MISSLFYFLNVLCLAAHICENSSIQPKAVSPGLSNCFLFPHRITKKKKKKKKKKTTADYLHNHKINPCLLSGPTYSVSLHHLIYSGYSHLVYFCTLSNTTKSAVYLSTLLSCPLHKERSLASPV